MRICWLVPVSEYVLSSLRLPLSEFYSPMYILVITLMVIHSKDEEGQIQGVARKPLTPPPDFKKGRGKGLTSGGGGNPI